MFRQFVQVRLVSTQPESKKRVVVLGCGWGGFNFLRDLDSRKYDVSCVSPANHFLFTPLLPSCAVGTLEFRAIQEPVRTIPNLNYYQAKAKHIIKGENGKRDIVVCRDIFENKDFELEYDWLVVTCGSKTHTFGVPGVAEREGKDVLFLKHLHHARQVRNRILECFERAAIPDTTEAERRQLLSFVVVGGGPTSCEFVGELHDFIQEDCGRWYPDLKPFITVTLVEAGPHLLSSFDRKLSEYVLQGFTKRQIDVKTGISVKTLEGTSALLSDGTHLPFGMMVWSAGLQPVKFVSEGGMRFATGPTGRILTDQYLRVKGEGNENVFAFGDCAVVEEEPLPPIAQAAMQEAKYLSKVFNAAPASSGPTPEHVKQSCFQYNSMGSMAMLGGWRAVADFSHVGLGGKDNLGAYSGRAAFFLWRTAYWGRQVSLINKLLIPMYWFKAWLFGRDISRF